MTWNSALGLSLAALGAVLAVRRPARPRIVRVLGALTLADGAAATLEYVTGWNLGVDTLFGHPYLTEPGGPAGRPALSTAVCLLALGVGLIAWTPAGALRRAVTTCAAAVVAASITLVTLLGYLAGVRLGSTSRSVSMALPTALVLSLLSTAVLLLGVAGLYARRGQVGGWLSVMAGAAATIIAGLVWQAFLRSDAPTVRTTTASHAALAVAVVGGLLIGGSVRLAQRVHQRHREINELAAELEREVRYRSAVEREANDKERVLFPDPRHAAGRRLHHQARPVDVLRQPRRKGPAAAAVARPPGRRELCRAARGVRRRHRRSLPGRALTAPARDAGRVVARRRRRGPHRRRIRVPRGVGDARQRRGRGRHAGDGRHRRHRRATDRRARTRRAGRTARPLPRRDHGHRHGSDDPVLEPRRRAPLRVHADEAVGRRASDLIQTFPQQDRAEIDDQLRSVGCWVGEVTSADKAGTRVDGLLQCVARFDEQDEIASLLVIITDVGNLKAAHRELEERAYELERVNRELQRSNDDLLQFAYAASHDLAEPLRAISGPVSLLGRRYRDQLDTEADELIDFAVDGCARMQTLIDDLLAFSRVGRVNSGRAPVDVAELMRTVQVDLGPVIAERCAEVVVASELPIVWGTASELRQVLQNLIANALKFAGPGRPPVVTVAAEPAGPSWRFSVTDNGIGIPARHRERVFGMFKRLHARDEYPGTGIGLALVKKIVERHGGEVGVEDAPDGAGCRFWFVLPCRERASR